ncbi:MAG TPA: RNA methyltransferase [Parvularculaceae bacterium]|nr:RNA methyltransferase [Parvularculaceae bacterium]
MPKADKSAKLRKGRAESGFAPAPAVVMIEPQMGENIGAVARAMMNFGLSELVIVNPRDGWPNERAEAMASGAAVILEQARVERDSPAGLADFSFALAMTARPRESLLPVLTPHEAARAFKTRIERGERCAIILGPERAGLSNDDVNRSDGVISIPVNPAFASLNVAQALVVMAYEWAVAAGLEAPPADLDLAPQASKAQFEGFISQLFVALDEARYFHPPEKRAALERKIKTAFARAGLTEGEVRTMRGVIKALVRSGERADDGA